MMKNKSIHSQQPTISHALMVEALKQQCRVIASRHSLLSLKAVKDCDVFLSDLNFELKLSIFLYSYVIKQSVSLK